MLNNTFLFQTPLKRTIKLFFLFSLFSNFGYSVMAEPDTKNEIPKDREIHNTFSDGQKKGTLLDATNPLELMNRLRQASAMENATNPSDAIDDAIKAFSDEEIDKYTLGNPNGI